MNFTEDFKGIGKIFEKFPDLDLNIEFSDDQRKIIKEANEMYSKKDPLELFNMQERIFSSYDIYSKSDKVEMNNIVNFMETKHLSHDKKEDVYKITDSSEPYTVDGYRNLQVAVAI